MVLWDLLCQQRAVTAKWPKKVGSATDFVETVADLFRVFF